MDKKAYFLCGLLLVAIVATSLFWWFRYSSSSVSPISDEIPIKDGIEQLSRIPGGVKFLGTTRLGDSKELNYGVYNSQDGTFSLLALPQQEAYPITSGSSGFLSNRKNGKLFLFNVLTGENKAVPLPFLLKDDQQSYPLASETEDNKFLIQIDDTVPADGMISFEVVRSRAYVYDVLSDEVKVIPPQRVNKKRAFSFVNCKKFDSLSQRVFYWYCFEGTGSSAPVLSEDLETGKEKTILADTSKNTPSNQDFERVFAHEDRLTKLSTVNSPKSFSFFSFHGERAELVLPEELTLSGKAFFEADFLPQHHTLVAITNGGTLTLVRYNEENKAIVEMKEFQSSYDYDFPYPEFYVSGDLVYWFWNDKGDLRVINIQDFSFMAEFATPLRGEIKSVILK